MSDIYAIVWKDHTYTTARGTAARNSQSNRHRFVGSFHRCHICNYTPNHLVHKEEASK